MSKSDLDSQIEKLISEVEPQYREMMKDILTRILTSEEEKKFEETGNGNPEKEA